MKVAKKEPASSWDSAVRLLERWLIRRERVEQLLESLPGSLATDERANIQHLLYGAIRHFSLLDSLVTARVSRTPRPLLRAALILAAFELLEGRAKASALVVDHAVERSKRLLSGPESKLVNAVARKLAIDVPAKVEASTEAAQTAESAGELAEIFSHPAWLVDRWLKEFGIEATRKLLVWNQQSAPVYARWRAAGAPPPASFTPTEWPSFYEVSGAKWSEVQSLIHAGKIYLQDPATRFAPDMLGPKSGAVILDCCASPGGKTLYLADMIGQGKIVAVDKPGPRIKRLQENVAKVQGIEIPVVQSDLVHAEPKLFKELGLPTAYDFVLLDAPCSNTGVLRHRVDAKWRLKEGDVEKQADQQLELLFAAARMVGPRGRLVYSTCSLEKAENEGVVAKFLRARGKDFAQENRIVSRPWESGHDGAGVFLLQKRS